MLKAELVLNGQWSIQFQRLKKNGKIACCETANVLLLLLFLDPGTSFPRCETLSKVCELSGWPLWGLGNECVGQEDRVKTLDCCWDALIQESRFARIGCTQWCSPADLGDEFVCLVRQGAECLNGHGVEHVTGQKIIIIIIIITRLMTHVKVIHRLKNRKCGWSRISEGKLRCKVQSLPIVWKLQDTKLW